MRTRPLLAAAFVASTALSGAAFARSAPPPAPAPTAAPTTPAAYVAPNLYQLVGENVHLTYSVTGVDGKPHLVYQDAYQQQSFSGSEIKSEETALGTLVTVYIRKTIDMGSTSLTLLVPHANLNGTGDTAEVATYAITAIHRFSPVHQFNHGPTTTYSSTALHGTARMVVF